MADCHDVISPELVSVIIDGVLQTLVDAIPTGVAVFGDFFVSNSETRYHVDNGMIYPNAANALSFGRSSMFTLGAASAVGFAMSDIRPLADNRGGISLLVSSAAVDQPEIPEPSTLLLTAFGLVAIVQPMRKARQPAVNRLRALTPLFKASFALSALHNRARVVEMITGD